MTQAERLFELAQSLVYEWPNFFVKKGAGAGDRDTYAFMEQLKVWVETAFGRNYYEQRICGVVGFKPDFYFPDEATIVEIAMGLRNPSSEYERDIFKALLDLDLKQPVQQLVFFAKPGALDRFAQPGQKAIASWVQRTHGIAITVREFSPQAEAILEPDADAEPPT
jgi:hypothetical protein